MKPEEKESSFDIFRKEVNKYPIFSEEEQNNLLKKYNETGSFEILEEILKHNLRLSIKVAKRHLYNRKCMDIMDLIQECNISLLLAIETYRIESTTKFSTYAIQTMEKNLITAMGKQDDSIRRPVYLNLLEIRKNKFIAKIYQKEERYPTEKELREYLNVTDETYKYLLVIKNYDVKSLNEAISEDEEEELQDFIEFTDLNYEKIEDRVDDLIILKAAKLILIEEEYYVVYNRYLTDTSKSREDFGKSINLSRERIRQIENKGLTKLKMALNRRKQTILANYTIEELEKEDMKPLELSKKCLYLYLKENLKKEEYYYIYTKNIKKYEIGDYKEELKNISEREIKEQIRIFNEMYESIATPEFIEENFKNYINKYGAHKIFKMSIVPEIIEPKKSIKQKKKIN